MLDAEVKEHLKMDRGMVQRYQNPKVWSLLDHCYLDHDLI